MTDILMPALSPTMEEGVLAKWNIKAGDTVSAGDVIAEIETDKATMEVEAVDEGVVDAILVPAGTEGVKVNTPIARLKGEGGASPSPQPSPQGGEGEGVAPPRPSREREGPAPAAREGEGNAPAASNPIPSLRPAPQRGAGEARLFASPLARRIADQKGLELSAVKGSGPHGRIVKADVEAAKPGATPAPQPAAAQPGPVVAPPRQVQSLEQMGIASGSYDLVPLDGMGKTIARRMSDSFRDIPHFPLTIDLEIDRLLDARVRINARLEKQGVKVSVNDIVIKAAALALKAAPDANVSYTPEGIARHHHADIAVAVALEHGLITPIIREAENRSLADIATTMKDLAERARARKLKPEEYQGGTFSISNLGMMGIKSFASIINEPQGCILSVGAGEKRAVVRGDQLAIATVMTVTLTCDHRAVDGAIGSRFLAAFKGYVEDPVTMLA
jgi:pyruvate dehydrogenase E2 component (dihydrolipoamide acetyltransferase)